jgi:hypothetical protein
MLNVNPTLLEYSILAIAFIGITILTSLRVMTIDQAIPILTGIITYAVGAAKGASTVQAIQNVNTPDTKN